MIKLKTRDKLCLYFEQMVDCLSKMLSRSSSKLMRLYSAGTERVEKELDVVYILNTLR